MNIQTAIPSHANHAVQAHVARGGTRAAGFEPELSQVLTSVSIIPWTLWESALLQWQVTLTGFSLLP